jgi:predicted nucleic acid-binding Zn ribbon protein
MIRKCVICGKEFETKSSRQITCSKQCSYKEHYNKEMQRKKIAFPFRNCKMCGKEFIPTSKEQFCSDECRNKSKLLSKAKVMERKYESGERKKRLTYEEKQQLNKPNIMICAYCGTEFTGRKRKYCTSECMIQATKEKQVEYHKIYMRKNRSKKPIVYKECKFCGKQFEYNKDHQVYCSDDCRLKSAQQYRHDFYQSVRDKTYKICPVCGKEFLVDKHHEKYCSNECREKDKCK